MATQQLNSRAVAQTSGLVQLGEVTGKATFISDAAGGVAVHFDLKSLTPFQVRLLTHYQRATRPVSFTLPLSDPQTVAVIGFEQASGMVYVSPLR
jgi:hypothetical protein